MNCCKKPNIKDLAQGLGEKRHLYCSNCKSHKWDGILYSKKEWSLWINTGEVEKDQLEMFS